MDPLRHSHRKLFGCSSHPQNHIQSFCSEFLQSLSSFSVSSPTSRTFLFLRVSQASFNASSALSFRLDQALDRLVLTSFYIAAFTPSTYLPCRLQGVLPACSSGNLFLEVGFTLRCFQRLSRPYFASQLCRWHDNCFTRGTSIPVLSY